MVPCRGPATFWGTPVYLGTPIGRFELVKLFSSILKREEDKYFLVTPVEKVGIHVEDAPFVAVDFTVQGSNGSRVISFETQVGDQTSAGTENPLRFVIADDGEPAPYVHVRNGLEALIDRKSFYRLIELGHHEDISGESWFGISSEDVFFPIIKSHVLDV